MKKHLLLALVVGAIFELDAKRDVKGEKEVEKSLERAYFGSMVIFGHTFDEPKDTSIQVQVSSDEIAQYFHGYTFSKADKSRMTPTEDEHVATKLRADKNLLKAGLATDISRLLLEYNSWEKIGTRTECRKKTLGERGADRFIDCIECVTIYSRKDFEKKQKLYNFS